MTSIKLRQVKFFFSLNKFLVLIFLSLIILLACGNKSVIAINNDGLLSSCERNTNCTLIQFEDKKNIETFTKLVLVASNSPRTTFLKEDQNYWHGIVKSPFFRFIDDLEILCIPEQNIIQIKSAARSGIFDLRVNKRRVYNLISKL